MNYFMVMSGIEGDINLSGFTGFEKCFQIASFNLGALNGGGGGTTFRDLDVVLRMGKGIPITLLRLGNGTIITAVTILGVSTTADKLQEREKYRFDQAKVASQSISGSDGDGHAWAALAFTFSKMTQKITRYRADGTVEAREQYYWDLVLNRGGTGTI